MLSHLFIKNYVLIQEISVTLSDRFNVFTGETGAGKSLLVDALNFVSGQRSSASIVGKHGQRALVEATFIVSDNKYLKTDLRDRGYIDDEDDVMIVTREMNQDGKNTCRINGRVVTVSVLRELTSLCLDIHSQHETQYLLNENHQQNLLDSFMNKPEVLAEYQKEFQEYARNNEAIRVLKDTKLDRDELEFSKYQLKELTSLNFSQNEYESIKSELYELENYEKTKSQLNTIEDTLTRSKDVLSDLFRIKDLFSALPNLQETYNDIYYRLEDISRDVSTSNQATVFDEYRFNELQDRVFKYNQSIRKHGSLDAIFSKISDLQNRINNVENQEEILSDLEAKGEVIRARLAKSSVTLKNARIEAAKQLEAMIVEQCIDLLLENVRFRIDIYDTDYRSNGSTATRFMVSMNKGEDLGLLSTVASGGELSRVMLALKVIFSKIQGITTLVFDEIDTGVSGRVALRIGEKMKEISKDAQVLTITHLSTVAACAHHHYLISKSQDDSGTLTSINILNDEARVRNLALMMSGSDDIDSLKAAHKLLEQGQSL